MGSKIKGLLILSFLLSSVWMGNAHLTGRDSPPVGSRHKTAQLACQKPPQDALTEQIIHPETPIYKDYFCPKEEVWVAVNPNVVGDNCKFKNARVYVVYNKEWGNGDVLEDVSCDGYETISIDSRCRNANMIYRCVWNRPNVRDEGYDVVVDFKPLGIYNKSQDILDGGNIKGFYVPKQ